MVNFYRQFLRRCIAKFCRYFLVCFLVCITFPVCSDSDLSLHVSLIRVCLCVLQGYFLQDIGYKHAASLIQPAGCRCGALAVKGGVWTGDAARRRAEGSRLTVGQYGAGDGARRPHSVAAHSLRIYLQAWGR